MYQPCGCYKNLCVAPASAMQVLSFHSTIRGAVLKNKSKYTKIPKYRKKKKNKVLWCCFTWYFADRYVSRR